MSALVILGGRGVVGQWAAAYLAAGPDQRTGPDQTDGPDHVVAVDLANGAGLHADARRPNAELRRAVRQARAVALALPEAVAEACLEWLPETALPTATVLPTCSVQAPFFARAAAAGMRQPLVGINPMFSPTLSPAGRPVVLITRDGAGSPPWVRNRLTAAGMSVTTMTPTEHDTAMSYLQALPHAATLAFAGALARAPIGVDRLLAIAPPPARTLIALACRILAAPAEVYWDIQHVNPDSGTRRRDLAQVLAQLDHVAGGEPGGQPAQFHALLDAAAQWFGPHLDTGAGHCRALFELQEKTP